MYSVNKINAQPCTDASITHLESAKVASIKLVKSRNGRWKVHDHQDTEVCFMVPNH